MKKFVETIIVVLLGGGIGSISTGIWIGGDWVAKFVWTGILAIILGIVTSIGYMETYP